MADLRRALADKGILLVLGDIYRQNAPFPSSDFEANLRRFRESSIEKVTDMIAADKDSDSERKVIEERAKAALSEPICSSLMCTVDPVNHEGFRRRYSRDVQSLVGRFCEEFCKNTLFAGGQDLSNIESMVADNLFAVLFGSGLKLYLDKCEGKIKGILAGVGGVPYSLNDYMRSLLVHGKACVCSVQSDTLNAEGERQSGRSYFDHCLSQMYKMSCLEKLSPPKDLEGRMTQAEYNDFMKDETFKIFLDLHRDHIRQAAVRGIRQHKLFKIKELGGDPAAEDLYDTSVNSVEVIGRVSDIIMGCLAHTGRKEDLKGDEELHYVFNEGRSLKSYDVRRGSLRIFIENVAFGRGAGVGSICKDLWTKYTSQRTVLGADGVKRKIRGPRDDSQSLDRLLEEKGD